MSVRMETVPRLSRSQIATQLPKPIASAATSAMPISTRLAGDGLFKAVDFGTGQPGVADCCRDGWPDDPLDDDVGGYRQPHLAPSSNSFSSTRKQDLNAFKTAVGLADRHLTGGTGDRERQV